MLHDLAVPARKEAGEPKEVHDDVSALRPPSLMSRRMSTTSTRPSSMPLSIQGNPALKGDWETRPDGTPVDFLAFARSEGRFARHFAADGTPSPEILATQQDRLGNWRTLKELGGLT
jgi:hypothetical protein